MANVETFTKELSTHRIIGVDSSIFIYSFEQHPDYEPFSTSLFDLLSAGTIEVVTSAVTSAEALIQPFRKQDAEVIALYENVFEQLPHFKLVPIDYPLSKIAASLRAKYSILLPDAFQIAAALEERATLFVTNDVRLKKVKEVKIVCLQDYV